MPGKDLQQEEVDPQGLDIDYFLGKGLPDGAGGYINYDHDPHRIVGVPEAGKIGPQGFWVRWRTLNTPFVRDLMEQMRALKDAGWPRRYGMSIEGVVQDRDPEHPQFIRRAFIRNVAFTPTPVHPATFVDFAKSLNAASQIALDPRFGLEAALRGWVQDWVGIRKGWTPTTSNRYFRPDGRLRPSQDIRYFREVGGLDPTSALEAAHWVARHETAVLKAWSRLTAWDRIHRHLQRQRQRDPTDPHLTPSGGIRGGDRGVAAHFLTCEGRPRSETVRLVALAHGAPWIGAARKESYGKG